MENVIIGYGRKINGIVEVSYKLFFIEGLLYSSSYLETEASLGFLLLLLINLKQ